MTADTGPAFFLLDDIPWPEAQGNAPKALVEEARRLGAKRKFLATGEGGFHSQYSVFPPGYEVPRHSHDHDEMIVVLEGSCTMLDGGPELQAHDTMVLRAGYEYGFTAGEQGMEFLTIRTGAASVRLA
jgi:quercetin dioxygenase-like cupin family protein